MFLLLLQKKDNNKEEAVRLRAGLKCLRIGSICKQRTELVTYIKDKVFPEQLTLTRPYKMTVRAMTDICTTAVEI